MLFPERPTCHRGQPNADLVEEEWRPPDDFLPVRTCSYCGSIHPEDLLRLLDQGAELEGATWKYGWPHKFYVEGIPNPAVGQMRRYGSDSRGVPRGYQLTEAEQAEGWHWVDRPGIRAYIERELVGPAPATLTGKWYNTHLCDAGYDPATWDRLVQQLAQHSDIEFFIQDGRLGYRAPYLGYQRATRSLRIDPKPPIRDCEETKPDESPTGE